MPETENVSQSDALTIGHVMANQLLAWRPTMSTEDVASALMHAMERYSIQLEGPSESGMRGIIHHLQDYMERRLRAM